MKKLLTAVIILVGLSANAQDSTLNNINKTANTTFNALDNNEVYAERKISTITEAGVTYTYGKPLFSVYQAVGAKLNPYIFIGEGVGIQINNTNQWQMQILTDLRIHALNKWVTPTFTLQAGLNKVGKSSLSNEKSTKTLKDNSMNINAGAGVLFRVKENVSFSLTGGYSLFSDFNNSFNGGFAKFAYVF